MDELDKLNAAAEQHRRDLAELEATSAQSPLHALAEEIGREMGAEENARRADVRKLQNDIANLQIQISAIAATPITAQIDRIIEKFDQRAAAMEKLFVQHEQRMLEMLGRDADPVRLIAPPARH